MLVVVKSEVCHCWNSITRRMQMKPILLLFAVWMATVQAEESTPTPSDLPDLECHIAVNKTFKFVLKSTRNQTGHWIAQVQLEHERGAPGDKNEYEIQLEQTTKTCEEDPLKITSVITAPPPHAASPGPGYKLFPGIGFYKLNTDLKDWFDAKGACEDEGTHLAIVNSKVETMALLEVFSQHLDVHTTQQWDREAWIGVHDTSNEGNFKTVQGVPLSGTGYVRWADNEPNNYGSGEDCVTLGRDGRINDVGCSRALAFFCEGEL